MEWEWEPEQPDLGGLRLAGICRETSRVLRRAILPNFANVGPPLLSALLLADAALFCVLPSRVPRGLDEGTSLLRAVCIVIGLAASPLLHIVCVLILLLCTAAYVLCVASLYRTGGDLRAADRVLKGDLPAIPLVQLFLTFFLAAFPVLVLFASLYLASMHRVQDKIMQPLWLLGWASAAYAAAVCQLACVVSVLEDAAHFGAVRRSRELLAGKFWAAACVFVTPDGCIIAVLKAFTVLVVDDALGLGLWFQMAAGATMFVALRAVLVFTLVAQPVVYMVCKSHHKEVVDMAHLD